MAAKRMEGKVAIVTASTQGIGLAIAERLGLEGASVVVSSRKKNNVDEAVETLKSKGIDVLGVPCHVSNRAQRQELIRATVEKYGHIDILVSNAAVNPTTDGILEIPESVLDKLWEINVKATILLVQEAAKHLTKNSSVIIITSIAGYSPQPSMSMYGVTKTALLGLTKALAVEMAPDTRVNAVAPGFVPTHFADFLMRSEGIVRASGAFRVRRSLIHRAGSCQGAPGMRNIAQRKGLEEKTLLGRLGKTTDMASTVAFLASEDASYITGETIIVAGGVQSRL